MTNQPEREEVVSRPDFDRPAVEAQLGFPLNPPFEPQVIGRDEALVIVAEYARLNDEFASLAPTSEQRVEAGREFCCNRVRQLLGSIVIREHELLERLVGPGEVEAGEIRRSAIRGLSAPERDDFLGIQRAPSEQLDYDDVRSKLDRAIQHGLINDNFGYEPNRFHVHTIAARDDDGEVLAVKITEVRFDRNRAIQASETLDFAKFMAAAEAGPAALAEFEQQKALADYAAELDPAHDPELTVTQLSAYMSSFAEYNRRLAILGDLDDLALRTAVLNGTGLDKLLSEHDPAYGSWS